jgi:hypothetical protein
VVVGTREVFSEQELAQLRGFPEVTRAELIKDFTLTGADEGFVRKFASQRNVLGTSVQLCSLPWLGFVPDEITAAPEEAATRLADRLGIPVAELAGYGQRAQTRTDHLREIVRYLGWRPAGMPEWKELDEVFVRSGDGARFAKAAVHAGVRVFDLRTGGPSRGSAPARARRYRAGAGTAGDLDVCWHRR